MADDKKLSTWPNTLETVLAERSEKCHKIPDNHRAQISRILKLTETVPWVSDRVDDVGDATDSWIYNVIDDGINYIIVDRVNDVVVDPVANAADQSLVNDGLVILERSGLACDDQESKDDCWSQKLHVLGFGIEVVVLVVVNVVVEN